MNVFKVKYVADGKKKDYMIVVAENERQAKRFASESLFNLGYTQVEIKNVRMIE